MLSNRRGSRWINKVQRLILICVTLLYTTAGLLGHPLDAGTHEKQSHTDKTLLREAGGGGQFPNTSKNDNPARHAILPKGIAEDLDGCWKIGPKGCVYQAAGIGTPKTRHLLQVAGNDTQKSDQLPQQAAENGTRKTRPLLQKAAGNGTQKRHQLLQQAAGIDTQNTRQLRLQAAGNGTHKRRQLLQQAATPVPLRWHIKWQFSAAMNATAQQVVKDMVQSATSTLSRILKLRYPPPNPMKIKPTCIGALGFPTDTSCIKVDPDTVTGERSYCKWVNYDLSHFGPSIKCRATMTCSLYDTGAPGVADTDLVLYVTSVDNAGDSIIPAINCSATENPIKVSTCNLFDSYQRPVVLNLNVCTSKISLSTDYFDTQTEWMIQGLLLKMGFSFDRTFWWVNTTSNALDFQDDWVEEYPNPTNASNPVTWVHSPAVAREVRRHYGCPDAVGMPLEDDRLPSDVASEHLWEYRIAQGDLMASGPPLDGARPVLSRMDLAVLEDTGLYLVDYSYAGLLQWGWQAGCGFLNGTCQDAMVNASFPWFCNISNGDRQCSHDFRSVGTCVSQAATWGQPGTPRDLGNGCGMVRSLRQTPNCIIPGSVDSEVATLPFWNYGSRSRCMPVEYPLISQEYLLAPKGLNTSVADHYCLNINCSVGLRVNTSGESMVCPQGMRINLTTYLDGFQAGSFGPCPAQSQVCQTVCTRSCNEPYGGICVAEKCYCHLGYTGDDCSQRYWLGSPPALKTSSLKLKTWARAPPVGNTTYKTQNVLLAPSLSDRLRAARGWLITAAALLALDLLLLGLLWLCRAPLSRAWDACRGKSSKSAEINMTDLQEDVPAEHTDMEHTNFNPPQQKNSKIKARNVRNSAVVESPKLVTEPRGKMQARNFTRRGASEGVVDTPEDDYHAYDDDDAYDDGAGMEWDMGRMPGRGYNMGGGWEDAEAGFHYGLDNMHGSQTSYQHNNGGRYTGRT